jgi:hypothetical protein
MMEAGFILRDFLSARVGKGIALLRAMKARNRGQKKYAHFAIWGTLPPAPVCPKREPQTLCGSLSLVTAAIK